MSKRILKLNEPVLYHVIRETGHAARLVTRETGHTARLTIVPENFAPSAIDHAGQMLIHGTEVNGLHFTVESGMQFTVWTGPNPLTANYVEVRGRLQLRLTTHLLPGILQVSDDIKLKLAGAEQCAAVALAIAAGMKLPGYQLLQPILRPGRGARGY